MTNTAAIRDHRLDAAASLAKDPTPGQSTSVTRAVVTDGFHCTVSDGQWTFEADLPESVQGGNRAPAPGVYGRGALASCVAMGIVGWAAQLEIPLNGIEVTVEADWDSRGDLGVDDSVAPGYSEVRVSVALSSPAERAELEELVSMVDRYSPYIDVFRRANGVAINLQKR